jgi:phosphoglycerate dehydrogenase-like enzyme
MPVVLINPERMREQPGPHIDLLRSAGFEIRYPNDPHLARGLLSDEETIRELAGIDATLASTENYNQRVLESCPALKVIARTGVGYDRVDVSAATRHHVAVTITPNSNHEAVAELAIGLAFAVAKTFVYNDKQVRSGAWPRRVLAPLRGKTLGILGLGRTGRSTAVRGAALGMQVIAAEKFPDEAFLNRHGIELVSTTELYERSDYLSLHCPLTDETRGLFNRDVFAKMKKGSVLINTSRGPIVDEPALAEALTSGHLRGAGLDVFRVEPPEQDNPLLQLDNVVLSPHMAGADEDSSVAMGVEAAECIVKLRRGDWPEGNVVNDELRSQWRWS